MLYLAFIFALSRHQRLYSLLDRFRATMNSDTVSPLPIVTSHPLDGDSHPRLETLDPDEVGEPLLFLDKILHRWSILLHTRPCAMSQWSMLYLYHCRSGTCPWYVPSVIHTLILHCWKEQNWLTEYLRLIVSPSWPTRQEQAGVSLHLTVEVIIMVSWCGSLYLFYKMTCDGKA